MAVTDVLRPTSTRKNGASTVVPSGTRHGVTSDDSDASYVSQAIADNGSNWNLRVGSHTPPANHQRHRIRGRIRVKCNAGTCVDDIDVGRGTSDWISFLTVPVSSSFAEQASNWSQHDLYGLDTAGALADLNIGGGWGDDAAGGATAVHTAECYIDIDCRARPDYTPEVRDAAGVDQSGGTVTDTNQPTLYFGGVAYDDLPALDWSVTVGLFEADGSGTPPSSIPVTIGLDDGSYTATFTVRSTIRGSDPFEHVQTITFDVNNEVPPPSPPLLTVEPEMGGYRLSWSNPSGQAWDDDYVIAEVWRDDCYGSQRIATIEDGLNGSYLDLAIPQLDPIAANPDCEVSTEPCDITYRVRYWGYVSSFVELPDTIPADLILGWPGSVGSIPSGWTRVTALDAVYPRGASTSGTPSATGGSASHTHTTSGHNHSIAAHSHAVGGSTGSSNVSTTSARFNGASLPQADQPHTHTRAASTGIASAQTSTNSSPSAASTAHTPPTRDVIWIESDGSQAQYPVGVLGWATESVAGWEDDTNSSGRFLKGAAAAGAGGTNTGASTHTHSIASHTHAGASHDHTLAQVSQSNPASSQEAGTGSSTPKFLARHSHAMDVVAASVGTTSSSSGGTSSAVNIEPPNRRLRVLINAGGGTQTRIIGLYLGDIASLDPLLVRCDGTNGTPDMRTYFARDNGSDSINSIGGSSSHSHTTPNHGHTTSAHDHATNVLASGSGQYERPTSGDLGDSPTTTHDHSTADTSVAIPSVGSNDAGNTSSTSHLPAYREAHFVRLDGTISGGPLPVPELKVSDFASITVESFTYGDGLDRLATLTDKIEVATDRSHMFPRLVNDSVPLDGGLHTVSGTTPGEDVTLTIAVEGLDAINHLEEILMADRVYWSPVGGIAGWFAPGSWRVTAPAPNVKLLQVTMVRQSWPEITDPETLL